MKPNQIIHHNRQGRPFILQGTEQDESGVWWEWIRFTDTGEFKKLRWERIKEYADEEFRQRQSRR